MAQPYYRVNNVDILPFIIDEGIEWEEEDLDAEGSGRTLDGVMHRTRVASKDQHSIRCKPLTTENANIVLQAVSGSAFVTVSTNIHPKYGTYTGTMYNSSRVAAVFRIDDDGSVLWDNIAFTLIGQ